MRRTDEVAVELAVLQCGAFSRRQLLDRGVNDRAIRDRLRSGSWRLACAGVYVLAGATHVFEQRLWVGWLAVGPDAVISHEAAAQLHGIPAVVRNRVTLICAHGLHHRLPDITVHQIDDVLPEHRTSVGGLPTTTRARTIVDLAAVVHPARLLPIVEGSKHAGLVSYNDVGVCMTSVARRGKRGIRRLAKTLDTLTGTKAKTMSELERMFFELVRRGRLGTPVSQFAHPGRRLPNGCVDAAYVDAKLIVELDGRAWHTRIADIKRDSERDAEAARHGWQTLRLLWEHVHDDPDGTADLVRDILRQRHLQLAS